MSKEAERVIELFSAARTDTEYQAAMAECGELDALEQLAMIDSIIDARLRVRKVLVRGDFGKVVCAL